MDVTVLEPLGVLVSGLDLTDLPDAQVAELRELLGSHGVVVFRKQRFDDTAFVEFLRRFGPLTFTTGETPVDGHPDLNVVSNVGRTTPPKSNFHVDSSYLSKPPAFTALRAVAIAEAGGQTLFSDQYAAYDTLPAELRDRLAGRRVTHVATGVELSEDDEASAEHDLFAVHPVTGRTSLYLSTVGRCAAITGFSASETRAIISELLEHSTRSGNVHRHAWEPGDIVMWDNRCVLHKADHDGVVGDRVMHRGMVAS